MIQKFDSLDAWNASTKSATESTISLAGLKAVTNGVMVEKPLDSPADGDILFYDSNQKKHLIACDTYVAARKPADWTAIGVIKFLNERPMVIHKTNTAKRWAEVYQWVVTGFDMTNRTYSVTLTNNYAANEDRYTITASDLTIGDDALQSLTDYVSTMNADIAADGKTDKFSIFEQDGKIILQLDTYGSKTHMLTPTFKNTTTNATLTLTPNMGLEVDAITYAYIKWSGLKSSWTPPINIQRAYEWLSTNDNKDTTLCPRTTRDPKNHPGAITKFAYFGTSQWLEGDPHANWRGKWGDSEEGFRKMVEDMAIVWPDSSGVLSEKYNDGKKNTYALANVTCPLNGSEVFKYPAANYCANIGYSINGYEQGNWFLAGMMDVADLCSQLTYGLNGITRATADPVNRSLNAIGGSALSCTSYHWGSCRYSSASAWYYYWNGCINYYYFCNSLLAVPVALYVA